MLDQRLRRWSIIKQTWEPTLPATPAKPCGRARGCLPGLWPLPPPLPARPRPVPASRPRFRRVPCRASPRIQSPRPGTSPPGCPPRSVRKDARSAPAADPGHRSPAACSGQLHDQRKAV